MIEVVMGVCYFKIVTSNNDEPCFEVKIYRSYIIDPGE